MVAKVRLIQTENSYCLLTYFNLDKSILDQPPNLKTYFSYANESKEKALEKARDYGNGIADELGVRLEENLG